jgi:tetratricopeptide (TPR) repeat protein
MQPKRTLIVLTVIAALAGAGLCEAIGKTRLVGKVVDPDGNPVDGVAVRATSEELSGYEETDVTDRKGVFKLEFDEINIIYIIEFSKPGFVTLKTEQTWQRDQEGSVRKEFILSPGEDVSVDGVVPVTDSPEAATAYNEAVRAFEAKDYATAEAKMEEALGHDPDLRQGWVALSVMEYQQEDFQEAVAAAEKAMELGSTDEVVLRTRWDSYRQLGDEAMTAEAMADLERIGAAAEEAKRIYNEGVALAKAGDPEGAFQKFQESLGADPNLQPALIAVATTGLESGHYQEAFDAANTVLKDDPGNETAIKLRYNAALQIGDEGMIIGSLLGLAQVMPDVARQNLWHLAMAAYNANDMEAAKDRFNKVLLIEPNNAEAHYLLGLIYLGEDNKEKTTSHLEKFLALAPDSPDAASARDILSYLGTT